VRRAYSELNWRKLRREELETYRKSDGVYFCSTNDEQRLRGQLFKTPTAVIPNAADVNFYKPRAVESHTYARTVLFFGHLSYRPNTDGVDYFVREIWPLVTQVHPDACFKIVGARPSPAMLALAGPQIEVKGFVADLRPDLADSAVIVVPLRLGGGTRLKIVEAMSMGKAIVSTTLGAEGIEAVPGRDLLVEDQPAAFAAAINRLLANPALAARIGDSARQLAVERYAWSAAAMQLESFYRRIMEAHASTARTSGPVLVSTSV
jgi:glycosyltransferase involved in cell wall biosynthesis